jgi:hypothetical protein
MNVPVELFFIAVPQSTISLIVKLDEDPLSLSGLRQALYVANCLRRGLSEHDIIARFSGDEQLVKMWLSFLIHNHWIYPSLDDAGNIKWITTDKGMEWLKVIEDKFKD